MTVIENVGEELSSGSRRSGTASMNFEILGRRAGDVNGGAEGAFSWGAKGAPPVVGTEVVEV